MILSLREAAALVPDGATVAFGGMTLYRRPTALVREILRRRPRNLTIAALTGGFESDLLVGAGCVSTCRTCYFGLEIFGFAPMYTSMAARLDIVEETESSICGAFRGPTRLRAFAGTDFAASRPDIRIEGDVVHYPPIDVDFALIHVLEADRHGNGRFVGNLACDVDLAAKAKRTIVTAERIVDRVVPMIRAHDVVEAPKGAWPASCYPDYTMDGLEILRYVRACRDGRFEEYLAEFLSR
ncbi:MAG: CoA transferase subunit A [Planctomycetes bacterium]|nr:CoA transferase subunit A [Planctomycetota bacterium]